MLPDRRSPLQRDRRLRSRADRQPRRRGRAARRARAADRQVHVRLHLGRAERPVVDADVVEQAVEEAARGRAVGADPPDVRAPDRAGHAAAGDLGAVDVEAGRAAVVAGAQVLPLPSGRCLARVEVAGEAAAAERQLVVAAQVVDPEHRPAPVPAAEHADVLLGARLLHPGLERETALVEGAERAQVDRGAAAVEGERAAVVPAGPGRAGDRAVVAVAGAVVEDGAGGLVEGVGGDETRRTAHRGTRPGKRHDHHRCRRESETYHPARHTSAQGRPRRPLRATHVHMIAAREPAHATQKSRLALVVRAVWPATCMRQKRYEYVA